MLRTHHLKDSVVIVNILQAVKSGLLKILSKMGISLLSRYVADFFVLLRNVFIHLHLFALLPNFKDSSLTSFFDLVIVVHRYLKFMD